MAIKNEHKQAFPTPEDESNGKCVGLSKKEYFASEFMSALIIQGGDPNLSEEENYNQMMDTAIDLASDFSRRLG